MAKHSHKNWMFICLAVTAAVFVGHYLLPERRITLHPSPNAVYALYGAMDAESGTSAKWLDKNLQSWTCHYKQQHAYGCGWNLSWDPALVQGIDLTRFDAMQMRIDYQGTASRLRIYMRNYNPEYSTPNNIASTKFLSMTLPVAELQKPVRVDFEEFSVASWWLREQNVRRQWAQSEFDNIIQVGVDLIEAGEHKVRVHDIVLVGQWITTQTLLIVVIALWMAFFLFEGLVRFYQLYKKSQQEHKVIRALEDRQNSLEREKSTLKALADLDPLTGIFNRTGMESFIESGFGRESSNEELGVLLIDVDHFKRLNDTYGHNMGDKVLKAFAAAMAANLREDDAFARWGGEEFVIVCRNKNTLALHHFADKLRAITAQYTFGGEQEIHITISIGITVATVGDSFDEALKRADRALYRAKRGGRNRVEYEL